MVTNLAQNHCQLKQEVQSMTHQVKSSKSTSRTLNDTQRMVPESSSQQQPVLRPNDLLPPLLNEESTDKTHSSLSSEYPIPSYHRFHRQTVLFHGVSLTSYDVSLKYGTGRNQSFAIQELIDQFFPEEQKNIGRFSRICRNLGIQRYRPDFELKSQLTSEEEQLKLIIASDLEPHWNEIKRRMMPTGTAGKTQK
ncbi:unnamed protein product [Didymodactylos carnosus]|uniref:Uncharacterized protein n=1 Tax=Didymodactylos carnosus TaxID=1234261 RepID=A0A8S2D8B1_9BILA|nr:unnamed protein product [Didymodactylos carnosus]CAF3654389.1 unnamed protein product [Didymodactylos carnosus]